MVDDKIKLKTHDQWNYDNIILMAPSVKSKSQQRCSDTLYISGANLDEAIKFENIVEFFKAEGHNLIAFGDVDTRAYHR